MVTGWFLRYISRSNGPWFDEKCYILKVDNNGDTLWTKEYGGAEWNHGRQIQQTPDGGFIIVGILGSSGLGFFMSLLRTDNAGNMIWYKAYENPVYFNSSGFSVQHTADNKFIAVGSTPPGSNSYVIKVDTSGDTIWTTTYYGGSQLNSVLHLSDASYVAVGYSNTDVYVFKTEPDTLGIKEQNIVRENKTSKNATIYSGLLLVPEEKTYKVFDITGREINTLNPAPGIYFIEVDGKIRQKIIKVR